MKNYFLSLTLIASFLLTGCSRSEFLFDFADTFAVSKADDYLDLTSEQKATLKKDIQKDLQTAKKTVFPKLAKKLRALEPTVDSAEPTAEYLGKEMLELQEELKEAAGFFKDTAVKTALSLTPKQVDHFAKEVRDDIEDLTDKDDIEEAREKIEKRYRRSLEFWMGGISQAQREKITAFLVANPYPVELQAKNKEHVLSQFIMASKEKEKLKNFVETFVNDYEAPRLPEYKSALDSHKKAFQQFLAKDFWATVDATQKKNLRKNLLLRADELDRLAAKP